MTPIHDVQSKVRGFVQEHINLSRLGDREDLFGSGYVTSLFAIQLVMFVEKEFAIRLESGDLTIENFRSIADIARMVVAKTSGTLQAEALEQGADRW